MSCAEGDRIMLEFIFKYTWIGMIVLAYAIWGFYSIRDIIRTKRLYKDDFEFDCLNESSMAWILMSIAIIFGCSFIYWMLLE